MRMKFETMVIALALLGICEAPTVAQAEGKSMTVSGSGGIVARASREVYLDRFSELYDIEVRQVPTEGQRMAQLEAMVKSGRPIWDAMEVSDSDYPIGVRKNLFEPIDYSIVDPENLLPESARHEYGVVASTWTHGLAVRTDKLPPGRKMQSWQDFWDVETFPGPRSLSRSPQDNLEFALLADGVPAEELYNVLRTSEGIERALSKLDEIKPHISKWWTSGAQAIQLLNDGEAWFTSAYSGRIGALAQSGVPVEFVWDGAAMHLAFVGIPRGAQNVREAHLYARMRAMDADLMRKYIAIVPYAGYAPGLYDGLDESIAAQLTTYPANLDVQYAADEEFWADNIDEIREIWDEWLLF